MKVYKTQHEIDTFELASTGTIALNIPVALTSAGVSANATAPEYIVIGKKTVPTYTDAPVLVHPIRKDELYSAPLAASATLTVGTKYTINTSGEVTSTTTSGIFQVVEVKGTGAGDIVIGRF